MEAANERITVSREALRAELGELELRLVDRLADAMELKADAKEVDQLKDRVQSLELARAAREEMPRELLTLTNRVGALERFRYAFPSLAVVSFIASVVLGVLVYFH